MKLIIDIDKTYYEYVKYHVKVNLNDFLPYILIAKGVPLPKGHGQLKDVDAIHKEIEKLQNGISKNGNKVHISKDQYKGMCYARGIINEAPIIIEAESEVIK